MQCLNSFSSGMEGSWYRELSMPPKVVVQALKARGEPLLSSFECTPAGITEYFEPLQWKLTELLSPK